MINLKKYSVTDLNDFDLEFIKVDDEINMKYFLNVMLNNKKIGELHSHSKSNGSERQINFKSSDDHSPIKSFNYYTDLQKAKDYIKYQIQSITKFVYDFYENNVTSQKQY